jgi:hypothetical protein
VTVAGRQARATVRLALTVALMVAALLLPQQRAIADAADGAASTVTLIHGSGSNSRPDFTSMWRQGPDQINVVAYPTSLLVDATHGGLGLRLEERITFGSPDDQGFAPGMHVDYAPDLFGANGDQCQGRGDFTVRDISPDLSSFWITFSCGVGAGAWFGEVRYHEPTAPDVTIAPTAIDWPGSDLGQDAARVPVTLTNTGSTALAVSKVAISGTDGRDFRAVADDGCASIAPGSGCVVTVTFAPSSVGTRAASLTITDSSSGGEHTIPLTGARLAIVSYGTIVGDAGDPPTGGANGVFIDGPDFVNASPFGNNGLSIGLGKGGGSSPGYALQFNNPSGGALTTGEYATSPTDASIRSIDLGVVGVSIHPCAGVTGRLTVKDIAPDLSRFWITYEMHCSGVPEAAAGEIKFHEPSEPDIVVAPSAITWHPRDVGYKRPLVPLTVFNPGPNPLTISSVALSGADAAMFAVPNTCPRIEAATSCAMFASFQPSHSGSFQGVVTLHDSSAAAIHSISLVASENPVASTLTMHGLSRVRRASDPQLWRDGAERFRMSLSGSSVTVNADGASVYLSFSLPADQHLAVGDYVVDGSGDPNKPRLFVQGPAGVCDPNTGRFSVLDAPLDLSRIWLTYHVDCSATNGPTWGEIRYREPVDHDVVVADARAMLPTQTSGTASTSGRAEIWNTGTTPLMVSSASVTGPGAAEFSVGSLTPCANVAPGDFCMITLGFAPFHDGDQEATLTLVDNSAEHRHVVSLGGIGVGESPPPVAAATPAPPPQPITIAVAVSASATKIKHGHTFSLQVHVTPAQPTDVITLQVKIGSTWTSVKYVKLDKQSRAVFTIKLKKKGTFSYRIVADGNPTKHKTGTSKTVKIKAT